MELIAVKVLVAVLFGVIRFAFGTLPIQVCSWLGIYVKDGKRNIREKKRRTLDHTIAKLQSFGGGVLFATCFLHMMPEVYYSVRDLQKLGILTTEYPISQLVVSIGFFLIYFLEEISHWLISIAPPEPCKKKTKSALEEESPSVAIISIEQQKRKEDSSETLEKGIETKNEALQTDDTKSSSETDSDLNEELDDLIKTEVKTKQQILRCFTIVIALSLHAIFEGLALGLQHSETNIWYMFTAMSIHSATILFCIGLEIYLAGTRTRTIVWHMLFLAITSPIGVLIGVAIGLTTGELSTAKSTTIVLLEGISAGTILYITFFEVLNREKERRACRMKRAFFITAGFALMAALECLKIT